MTAPAAPKVTIENGVTLVVLGPGHESVDEHLLDAGLREALLKIGETANPPRVVLDLSQTTFFGSSFIEILFRIWNRLQERPGGAFAIAGLTSYCQEVLKIAHLDSLWRLFPDRASALAELGAGKS